MKTNKTLTAWTCNLLVLDASGIPSEVLKYNIQFFYKAQTFLIGSGHVNRLTGLLDSRQHTHGAVEEVFIRNAH